MITGIATNVPNNYFPWNSLMLNEIENDLIINKVPITVRSVSNTF